MLGFFCLIGDPYFALRMIARDDRQVMLAGDMAMLELVMGG